MIKNREISFGMHKLSLLDKIIYALRVKSIKKYVHCKDKTIMDVGCGYDAVFLRYIKDKHHPKRAIAYDLNLHTEFLEHE